MAGFELPTEPDEHTPLLKPTDESQSEKKATPLPKLQIAVLLFFQLAEPITSQCIYPFINQLVSELDVTGGDDRKVGYYAGLIESLFFAAEALFVLQWSWMSDYIGRKPVLLIGMAGLCISMLFFGLSKTFTGLVLSRCLVGMLNGNLGVIKSMMAELTDSTNMAQGFALMPVVWSFGGTVGPFIGGILSKPHDRWPEQFSDPFWTKYPYFLPCFAASVFSGFTFIITAALLKETVKRKPIFARKADVDPEGSRPTENPVPLRALMVRPVLLSVANYGLIALLDISYRAIQPLFYSTPIALGGLGQSPASIGSVLATFGLVNGIIQGLFFARVITRFGPRTIFLVGMGIFIALFGLFPVINALARREGLSSLVWFIVAFQLALSMLCDMAYGCVFMYITSSAPNKQSLGATNGLAQLLASIVRTIGPATATSLFAASKQNNWLQGNAVYVALIIITCLTLTVGRQLPRKTWNEL